MNKDYINGQIIAIGDLVNNIILTRGLKKKTVAEDAGISVNTLNNLIGGLNVNMRTVLSVFDTVGISLPDAVQQLSDRGFEFQTQDTDEAPAALDAEVLKEELQEGTSAEQLGWRLGAQGNKVAQVAETA